MFGGRERDFQRDAMRCNAAQRDASHRSASRRIAMRCIAPPRNVTPRVATQRNVFMSRAGFIAEHLNSIEC
jgi:hypothetical protein